MEKNPLTIRDVASADVGEVVELIRVTLAEFGLRFGEGSATDVEVMGLPASYTEKGGAFWVAVDSSGRVVGTCGIFPIDHTKYELRKMYIYPSFRGSGIAQRFLDKCVEFVRACGGQKIVLDTIHEMDRAIAFYERNGFVRDDREIRGARCSRGYVLVL